MKKILIVLCVFCFSNQITNAQDFKVGLKAGANFTKVDGASLKNEFKLNYHAGVFFELELNKKIGLQPEVLLSQSEAQYINNGVITYPNTSYKLNYLNIPILLKYKIGKIVVLNVGPQYSILINKNDDFAGTGVKAFKEGDFAMVGGIQLNFKYLRFYGRYNIGLNNINDINSSENWKSQQLQVGLGFRF
ncbi:MAG: porin family protein [Bacteroidetes bacterium]|jgi:hypothetical protein|nr:porin family protein [Bacteroidota bacterium]